MDIYKKIIFTLIFALTWVAANAHDRPQFVKNNENKVYFSKSAALAACSVAANGYEARAFAYCHYHDEGSGAGTYVIFFDFRQAGAVTQELQSVTKWRHMNFSIGGSFKSKSKALSKCQGWREYIIPFGDSGLPPLYSKMQWRQRDRYLSERLSSTI